MTIQQIKSDLENDIIDYKEALERMKKISKPWQTKKWETDKKKATKANCEQCGQGGVMVLENLAYPVDYNEIMQGLLSELYYKTSDETYTPVVTAAEVENFIKEEAQARDACPKCKRVALRRRKNYGSKFVCCNCTYEFDTPVEVQYWGRYKKEISAVDVRRYLELQKVQTFKQEKRQQLFDKNEKELGKQALLEAIEQLLRFISFKDTVTFCKTCALKMEARRQLLCYNCKENYFNYDQQDNCTDCKKMGRRSINPFKSKLVELYKRKKAFESCFPEAIAVEKAIMQNQVAEKV